MLHRLKNFLKYTIIRNRGNKDCLLSFSISNLLMDSLKNLHHY